MTNGEGKSWSIVRRVDGLMVTHEQRRNVTFIRMECADRLQIDCVERDSATHVENGRRRNLGTRKTLFRPKAECLHMSRIWAGAGLYYTGTVVLMGGPAQLQQNGSHQRLSRPLAWLSPGPPIP